MRIRSPNWISLLAVLLSTSLMSGCTALKPPTLENTHLYTLEAKPDNQTVAPASRQVLAVGMPSARPGYDTPQIAYQRQPLELEYFVTQRWADTPARMLKPLLVQALEPGFQAVVQAPSPVAAQLRLDTEVIRLQQDFTSKPSRVQFTLRAQLTDLQNKKIVAVKVFDESEVAISEDAYGGVVATNLALQRILSQLAEFCRNASTKP
ncbi:MAG: ABC-type transport auxiliary lipoprotein family protein [Gallionella sp.]|nr:ABC-type transport auxiliary lipoprotein family protein [Gallionella sp.]MDD4946636.1 ABC-type transport auxiliary lipoprotein family protein [Gallionella sp.]MDD5612600.1 ABC-type transport auxiliary lipoprotein family protein [Gallionella sp.]